jgi:hypothetical protein
VTKIVFLDIDGVLNSELYHKSARYVDCAEEDAKDWFKRSIVDIDPEAIQFLNNLLASTGAKVVITSTWRRSSTQEELQRLLNARGFTGEIISVTPVFNSDTHVRGNEILCWVNNNRELLGCYYYEFRNYVILDDDSDMLYWQKDNFILVDGYVGLTPKNCYKAVRILNSNISGSV